MSAYSRESNTNSLLSGVSLFPTSAENGLNLSLLVQGWRLLWSKG